MSTPYRGLSCVAVALAWGLWAAACGDSSSGTGAAGMGTAATGTAATGAGFAGGTAAIGGSLGAAGASSVVGAAGSGVSATGGTGLTTGGTRAFGRGRTGGTGGASGTGGVSGSGGVSAAAGGVGGTGAAGTASTAAAPTFTEVYAILMQNCGGTNCHLSGRGAAGLLLSGPATAYMNLVGATSSQCRGEQRVAAGDPDSSVLVLAIEHMRTSACRAPSMPEGRAMLSQADIDTIRAWIMAGALNN